MALPEIATADALLATLRQHDRAMVEFVNDLVVEIGDVRVVTKPLDGPPRFIARLVEGDGTARKLLNDVYEAEMADADEATLAGLPLRYGPYCSTYVLPDSPLLHEPTRTAVPQLAPSAFATDWELPTLDYIFEADEFLSLMRQHERSVVHWEDMVPDLCFVKVLPAQGVDGFPRYLAAVPRSMNCSAFRLLESVSDARAERDAEFPEERPETIAAIEALPLRMGPYPGTWVLPDSPLFAERG